MSPFQEAWQHVDDTQHRVEYDEECLLWACLDCAWVDSRFVQ